MHGSNPPTRLALPMGSSRLGLTRIAMHRSKKNRKKALPSLHEPVEEAVEEQLSPIKLAGTLLHEKPTPVGGSTVARHFLGYKTWKRRNLVVFTRFSWNFGDFGGFSRGVAGARSPNLSAKPELEVALREWQQRSSRSDGPIPTCGAPDRKFCHFHCFFT